MNAIKEKPKKRSVVVTTALNLANHTERRRSIDRLVSAYLLSLKPKGYNLVIHAVGSSSVDEAFAKGIEIEYLNYSNKNLGEKRNAGIEQAAKLGDVVIQVGSDDLLSESFIDFVADTFLDESVGSLKVRGFYEYDTKTGRLAKYPQGIFATAFRSSILDGDLYETALGNENIDLTLHTRLHSMSERAGLRQVTLDLPESAAYVFCKSGDELHSFDKHLAAHSTITTVVADKKASDFFKRHFSTVSFKTV